MNAPSDSRRSTLERWVALLVRYWSFNMTLGFSQGSYFPGFGYTNDEKTEMRSFSQKVSLGQFIVWILMLLVFVFPIIAMIGIACLYPVFSGPNAATLPASLFYLALVLEIAGTFMIGFPLAMLLSSALVGRWYRVADSDLPDRAAAARFFHKLWFQLSRIAVVMLLVLVVLWIYVPGDSKFWVAERLLLPVLAPAFFIFSGAYYFSGYLRRKA